MDVSDPQSRDARSPDARSRDAKSRDAGDIRGVVLAVAAMALFAYLIRFILLPFVVAGIIAYICTPLLDRLAARTRLPRPLLAFLLFLLLIGLAAFTVAIAGQRLVAEAGGAVTDLQGMIDRLSSGQPMSVFGHTVDVAALARIATARLHDFFGQPDLPLLAVGYGFATLMGTFLTVVLLCYFLVSGKSVARGLLWMVPPTRRPLIIQIGTRLDPVLKRYFLGILAIVIYAVIAAYIGLGVILHIDHAFLLALLTGMLETIPIIGSTAAAVIAGLVSLHTATGLGSILAFALYAVLLRLSIDQIVAPLVLGNAAHVHPVLIIFCFLAGAVLLGIPGVILAVPVALTVRATLATLYGEDQ
jgi:predicted PurR-regulated permease PerM